MKPRILLLICFVFVLTGCAETQMAAHIVKQIPGTSSSPQGYFKVGNPYKIGGRRYVPRETYSYSQTGIASWYGPNFHGKQTANGEIFDMYELTAAHRTLQMPSIVRVTNLENGRSLIVRINDRGPFAHGRVIDMSKRGAELLGFKQQGTARVKVELLSEESRRVADAARRGQDTRGTEIAANENRFLEPARKPSVQKNTSFMTAEAPPPAPTAQNTVSPALAVNRPVYIQVGSFSDYGRAAAMAESLHSYGNTGVHKALVHGRPFYRVRLGPFEDALQADSYRRRLAHAGYDSAIVTQK